MRSSEPSGTNILIKILQKLALVFLQNNYKNYSIGPWSVSFRSVTCIAWSPAVLKQPIVIICFGKVSSQFYVAFCASGYREKKDAAVDFLFDCCLLKLF
jgi:hypothetical protein